MTPREAAIELIRPYRGASLEWIRSTHVGHYYTGYSAQVGGCIQRDDGSVVQHSPDWIIVHKLDGVVVNARFSLKEIYAEVNSDQMALFDAD